ncbi:hypothetical protein [Sinorhizobium meliloti]|uniref:hypothetical protein n=1 Tax=Rhizobium meliloti TaxID=382 RepID=UPI0018658C80|nr:hypothetical protein [Sinorhizobium meliloti]
MPWTWKGTAGAHTPTLRKCLAQSDAEFDGRPWHALSKSDKRRYLQRSTKGMLALGALHDRNGGQETFSTSAASAMLVGNGIVDYILNNHTADRD